MLVGWLINSRSDIAANKGFTMEKLENMKLQIT